ncbi:hypothetical protein DL771_007006 [Monosporascus sp. 5C6A]|nr:hypothetical protein DL771_007006 [Monosporascus sp. 5C6A]
MLSSATAACTAILTSTLQRRVTDPKDPEYVGFLPPVNYVQTRTPVEVAATLKSMNETGSKFAIRWEGHKSNPNFSSVDGSGVVIDLRNLNSISVNKCGVAHIGAGNTWGKVYKFLEERGLTVNGG